MTNLRQAWQVKFPFNESMNTSTHQNSTQTLQFCIPQVQGDFLKHMVLWLMLQLSSLAACPSTSLSLVDLNQWTKALQGLTELIIYGCSSSKAFHLPLWWRLISLTLPLLFSFMYCLFLNSLHFYMPSPLMSSKPWKF